MKIAGLFAGIGGLELGMHQAGHETVLMCDILPTAREVIREKFPNSEYQDDICSLRRLPSVIDLITAGFPCQDLSQAGRTAGISGDRSGLIGEVFRLLSRRRVPNLVIENVPFMLQLGGGSAMRAIIQELENRRYRWAYRVVDTFAFGLPQRRERVFLVASRTADPSEILLGDEANLVRPHTDLGRLAHGFYWTEGLGGLGWAVDAIPTLKNGSTIGIPSPPAVLMPDGKIIKPSIEDAERLQGFPPGWTSPATRVARDSLRWGLVGNAVSVPVARWIGQRFAKPASYLRTRDMTFPTSGKLPRAARFDGKRRFGVAISSDPVAQRSAPLAEFLRHITKSQLLSVRATTGFLLRTRRARLRFEPGFIEAVERHLVSMGGKVPPPAQPKQMDFLAA
ncbi:MAG: DNA (cytosine-5-)-methyltransferase [Pseudomonadales bacterium]|nr:DNA (cytosine-5-)-methyltransferase [Pseudomonadales bacterium]